MLAGRTPRTINMSTIGDDLLRPASPTFGPAIEALGVWWRKLGLAGTNGNELTSQRQTDMGGGPTFYDCRVEIEWGRS